MAKPKLFIVARAHKGDRITDDGLVPHDFAEGDERLADPVVVAQLVKNGVLVAPDEGAEDEMQSEKSDPEPISNKAETVPANKADPKPHSKPAK